MRFNLLCPLRFIARLLPLVVGLWMQVLVLWAQTPGSPASTPRTWTLQQCVTHARNKNLGYKLNELLVGQANLNRRDAFWNRMPNLNFNANQGFNFGRSIDPFTNQFISQQIRTNTFNLTSGWTFFAGLTRTNTLRQTIRQLEATKLDLKAADRTLVISVTQAFLNVALAKDRLANSDKQLINLQGQVDQTEKLVKSGRQAEITLLQIKAQLATERLNQTQRRNQLQFAKLQLQQLMELPLDPEFDIEVPTVVADVPDSLPYQLPTLVRNAEQDDPALQAARYRNQANEMGLKVARGNYYPRFALNINLNTGYSSARKLFDRSTTLLEQPIGYLQSDPTEVVLAQVPNITTTERKYQFGQQLWDNFGQNVSLSMALPIFNSLQVRTNVQRAKLNLETSRIQEAQRRNALRQEVEQAWVDAEAARASFRAAEAQMVAQQAIANQSEEQFRLGLLGPLDYLTNRNNYLRALDDVSAARNDYLFKLKVLELYQTGRLSLE